MPNFDTSSLSCLSLFVNGGPSRRFELAVVIPSARNHYELRKVLRKTWFGDIRRQRFLEDR